MHDSATARDCERSCGAMPNAVWRSVCGCASASMGKRWRNACIQTSIQARQIRILNTGPFKLSLIHI
eukprot:5049484-Alexandrium_andersonii.AAC.1